MDVAYKRHSRRSTTSLNHLSLAPLTPKFPIGDEEELPDFNDARGRSSYIEGKSAPTTPGILSRDSSSARLTRAKQTAIPKSKSASHLARNKGSPRSKTGDHGEDPSEWLQRAGAIISSETRESKGQSWLVSRASSTSLVDNAAREDISFADNEFSPYSRHNSRSGSRVHSRVGSRRGSRTKIDSLTPLGSRTPRVGTNGDQMAGYFADEFIAEPDFVDIDEDAYEDADEEDKLARIARLRGFGLGSWVDKLIGWSLFAVEEDGEELEEDGDEQVEESNEEHEVKNVETRRRRDESERVVLEPPSEGGDADPVPRDEAGGWQDAAWLLSVATKVLL